MYNEQNIKRLPQSKFEVVEILGYPKNDNNIPAATAEPINGLILFLVNKFMNFASNTPPALPILKARTPITKMANVCKFKNAAAVVVAPTEIPKNIVQIFINSF